MLEWILRGLRQRRITTTYPARSERPADGFQGPVELLDPGPGGEELVLVCPTGAITPGAGGGLSLDHGRCIRCGECVRAAPERFAFAQRHELAAASRSELVDGSPLPVSRQATGSAASVPGRLGDRARQLRRSIHIRHIDTGSDGAEEWEIQALWNPYYDIQRLGFFLTSSPRHADILLVTGGVTHAMRAPLQRTWEIMPEPKAVLAAGTDACSGGLCATTGMTAGGVDAVLPVDVYVPGSPPSPIALLDGLLLTVGLPRFGAAR